MATPGEWKIAPKTGEGWYLTADDKRIGTIHASADDIKLMLAAPKLLAALQGLLNMQKGRDEWPEVVQAEAAIKAAIGTPGQLY